MSGALCANPMLLLTSWEITGSTQNEPCTLQKFNAATYILRDNTEWAVHSAEIQCCYLHPERSHGPHRMSCALCRNSILLLTSWEITGPTKNELCTLEKFNTATYILRDNRSNTEWVVHSAENAATYILRDNRANTEWAVYSAEIQCCYLQAER